MPNLVQKDASKKKMARTRTEKKVVGKSQSNKTHSKKKGRMTTLQNDPVIFAIKSIIIPIVNHASSVEHFIMNDVYSSVRHIILKNGTS